MEYRIMSAESFLQSMEKKEESDIKNKEEKDNDVTNRASFKASKKAQKKGLLDKLKDVPSQLEILNKKKSLWFNDKKNSFFYKRYLDRVKGGLWDRYADEATVTENRMKGDPVEILKNEAKQYISDIVTDVNKLYKEILDMSKTLESKTTAEECIAVIQKYCSVGLDETKSGHKKGEVGWDSKLLDATKFKIARILTRYGKRKIYGFTEKSMILKGYPTPNHIIVTMFVDNPQERPQEQSVTSIFNSADSFDILSDKEKQDIFNTNNMVESALKKTIDNKVINDIKQFRANALNNFKSNKLSDDEKKKQGKILDQIWEGMKKSTNEVLGRKSYIIRCMTIYFEMIIRINRLAIMSIKSMLEVENQHRDKRYDRSLNVSHQKEKDPDSKKEFGSTEKSYKNLAKDVNKMNGF